MKASKNNLDFFDMMRRGGWRRTPCEPAGRAPLPSI